MSRLRAGVFADDQRPKTDDPMDIADWRTKIDEIDRRLVELLSERAQAAHEIGKLKRTAGLPIYEPDRERHVFQNTQDASRSRAGPGPAADLRAHHRCDAAYPAGRNRSRTLSSGDGLGTQRSIQRLTIKAVSYHHQLSGKSHELTARQRKAYL